MMSDLVRLSLSLEQSLLERLEELLAERGYQNRSEFVRDLIRETLVREQWDRNQEVVGTITLVYDHHKPGLTERLLELQHDHHDAVLAVTHVHLSHHLCAEVIIMRAKAGAVREMANRLRQLKGVLHAGLSTSSTGEGLD